jgi:hypothetical protein
VNKERKMNEKGETRRNKQEKERQDRRGRGWKRGIAWSDKGYMGQGGVRRIDK